MQGPGRTVATPNEGTAVATDMRRRGTDPAGGPRTDG